MEQIQPKLDQKKKNAEKAKAESGVDVQKADADTLKLKKTKNKKRNFAEATETDQIPTNKTTAKNSGQKKKKVEEEAQDTENL